jgi:hypothetical protein
VLVYQAGALGFNSQHCKEKKRKLRKLWSCDKCIGKKISRESIDNTKRIIK